VSIRIAVLGYGFIANLHTRAAQSAGATVVSVTGHRPDRAAEFAARHGVERSGADWLAAVSADDVDAVVVGTPNSLHHPQSMAAIAAGKHVLVDKPMALDTAEAAEMRDAALAAGVTLCVGHMWRYRDEVTALRDRIAAGDLGRVIRTRGYGIHAGWGPTGWFRDPVLSGGGALIDMGIHAIDTVRFLLGDPAPVRVVASIGTGFDDPADTRGAADPLIDTDGVVLVDWSDGVRSVVESGWWQPVLEGVEAETEVYATGGHARIWPAFTASSPPPADYEHCALPMYAAQMADFLTCCGTGATPRASAEVGLEALRIVEAAYRSAAEVDAGSSRHPEGGGS
jgi:predicted dehydrogenase